MKKLIADGRVIRGWIGIQGKSISPVMARLYDITQVNGIIVQEVDPNSPAAKVGIQKNDIVIEIAGKKVPNIQSVSDIITDIRPGTKIKIKIIRNGKPILIPIVVANRPDYLNKPMR